VSGTLILHQWYKGTQCCLYRSSFELPPKVDNEDADDEDADDEDADDEDADDEDADDASINRTIFAFTQLRISSIQLSSNLSLNCTTSIVGGHATFIGRRNLANLPLDQDEQNHQRL